MPSIEPSRRHRTAGQTARKDTEMMMSEFTERTGFEPSFEEYREIEEAYYSFDGNKDEFCKAWVKDGGIERTCRERVQKIQELQKRIAEMKKEHEAIVAGLKQKLDRELEWKPYTDENLVSDDDYNSLAKYGRKMTDEEAVEWIAQEFGFDTRKIKIYHTAPIFEVNRHSQLRKVGEKDRSPIYDATDYYYVCFTVAGWEYEATNGSLNRI